MTPLKPDEALAAFMDGELDLTQEQSLFDELASSGDLRQEMKDTLSMREAVHKDLVAPPADSEPALMAAVGLGSGAAAGAAGGAAAGTVAGASGAAGTSGLASLAYTGAGLFAGFVIAFMLYWNGGDQNNMATASDGGDATTNQMNQGIAGEAPPTSLVPADTVYSVKYVTKPVVRTDYADQYGKMPYGPPTPPIAPFETDVNTESEATYQIAAATVSHVDPLYSYIEAPTNEMNTGTSARLSQPVSPHKSELPVQFRIRALSLPVLHLMNQHHSRSRMHCYRTRLTHCSILSQTDTVLVSRWALSRSANSTPALKKVAV